MSANGGKRDDDYDNRIARFRESKTVQLRRTGRTEMKFENYRVWWSRQRQTENTHPSRLLLLLLSALLVRFSSHLKTRKTQRVPTMILFDGRPVAFENYNV